MYFINYSAKYFKYLVHATKFTVVTQLYAFKEENYARFLYYTMIKITEI